MATSQEEDELAAAWGDEADGSDTATKRALSQTEIDDLMGFGDDDNGGADVPGLTRVVRAGLSSYERLPMLEIVFDRLVRILSTSLRHLSSDTVEINIDKISSLRFGDYVNSIPLPTMMSVFRAEEWDNFGLMVIDAPLIYTIVDVMLGGRKGGSRMAIDGRPYTTIERNLIEKMVVQILADLSTAFEPVCKVTFGCDRTEVNPRFAAISRPSDAVILIRMKLETDERGGFFEIVLPYATLEPIREVLLQQFMGERFGRDNIWENHLAEELRKTTVELEAVLGEQPVNLSEVLALKVGSLITFRLTADDPVQLRCGGVPLFIGRTGNRRNRIAVQIEAKLANGIIPETAALAG